MLVLASAAAFDISNHDIVERSDDGAGAGVQVVAAAIFTGPELLRNSQSAPFTPRPEGRGFSEQI
ncbi:hypothetical protein [Massilia polaris]|uniref:hypothetical protein n=1 Tax=Massilia polaris TaxID=2728846 RepID=UPI00351CDC0F